MVDMYKQDEMEEYTIEDELNNIYKVTYVSVDDSYSMRLGLLCRHVLFVFKNKDVRAIRERYIVGRWLKSSLVKLVHDVMQEDDVIFVGIDDNQRLSNNLTSSFFGWLQRFDGNKEKMFLFLVAMNDAGNLIHGNEPVNPVANKITTFQELYGGPAPEKVEVHPPERVNTKGNGRRIVFNKEQAVRDLNKPLQQCKKCMEWGRHDLRNCNKVNKKSSSENE